MNLNKRVVRRVLSFLLAWMFCLMSVVIGLVVVLNGTICSPSFLKRQIEKSGYALAAAQELSENYLSYGAAGGVDNDTMRSLIDIASIEADMSLSVDALYSNGEAVDYSAFRENTYNVLLDYANSQGHSVNDEVKEGLQAMADACTSDYSNRTTIPFLSYLKPLVLNCQEKWLEMAVLPVVAALASAALLFLVNKPRRWAAYMSQSFIGATLLCIVLNIWARVLLPEGEFLLNPQSLRELVVCYASSAMQMTWICAGAFAVLAVLFFVGHRLLRGIKTSRS